MPDRTSLQREHSSSDLEPIYPLFKSLSDINKLAMLIADSTSKTT